jgi:putative PIG3 family NAD(P)H quinone oxidoreductase
MQTAHSCDLKEHLMRAIHFPEFGDADVLQLRELPDPVLRPTDLLIRNHAVGVNRADITHRKGGYGRSDFGDSTLMGLEVAGEVIDIGESVVGFQRGDRVMAIVGGGAYAELSRLNYRMAMPIPQGLDYIQAAAIPEVFVTAHEALIHLGRLHSGESVLIHAAAGGVGSAAVQLAHASGARVFATAGTQKLQQVRDLGADEVIDYKQEDYAKVIEQATDGEGVDVVIDFVGAPYLERNIRVLKAGGRLIQVGILGGTKDAILPLEQVLYKHLQIIGTVMKSRPQAVKQAMTQRFRDRWLETFTASGLKPIIDSVFPLARAADAHRRMESNQSVGKIILTP